MGKPKRTDPLARRNRANKNRGRNFENRCAKALGWMRVPYSGANAAWGKGDVVDGYFTRDGKWQAECKTTQPLKSGISINGKWIKQMNTVQDGRRPVMFFTTQGSTKTWVLCPTESLRGVLSGKAMLPYNEVNPTDKGTFILTNEVLHNAQVLPQLIALWEFGPSYILMGFPHFVDLIKAQDNAINK